MRRRGTLGAALALAGLVGGCAPVLVPVLAPVPVILPAPPPRSAPASAGAVLEPVALREGRAVTITRPAEVVTRGARPPGSGVADAP